MNNLIPDFISNKYSKGMLKGHFKAYTMFIDISGFTNLTETLMHHKKDGAEVLTEAINNIFEPIISNIYSNKGIISTFAGDAFTTIFRGNEKAVFRSASYIKKFFDKIIIDTKYGKFEIGVKIGLSYGKVNWGILGKHGKHTYFFRGEAIDGCAFSEQYADKGEIVIDKRLQTKLNIPKNDLKRINNDFFEIKLNSSSSYSDKISKKKKYIELQKKDLTPFVLDAVINFKKKAEFRNVACMFVSFEEPRSAKKLNDLVTSLIDHSYDYGGYFNKIDFGDKGGVALIIFGAPISNENNIERAMDFIEHIRKLNKNINCRISLTYGTVYAGIMGGKERCEYTAIGDIVNLSSRLVMSAEWNNVHITSTVYQKIKNNFSTEKVGDVLFKGKSSKTTVYKVTGKLSSKKISLYEGKMHGRDSELKDLKKYIAPVFKNKFSGITYVFGEAGIGKSRLVYEFKNSLDSGSMNWFYLPCEEILRKSFNPVIYFLKKYFNILDESSKQVNKKNFDDKYTELIQDLRKHKSSRVKDLITNLNNFKSIIGGFLGIEWKNSLFANLDSKDRFENFLFSFKDLIKAESYIRPVIIQIDDSHLIDNDSMKLIDVLTRNIEDLPIAIICTSRYNDKGEFIYLEVDPAIKKNIIDLNFLRKESISGYANDIIRSKNSLSKKFLDFIYNKTNGNPFFVEQLLLDLKDKGLIRTDNKKELFVSSHDIEDIPSNIQAVVISRLDRLTEEVKNIVQTASILGREFLIRVLSGILKQNKIDTTNIELVENENIWTPLSNINYIFKHALMRDSAYDMQLRSRLKKLHKLAAENYIKIFKNNIDEYYNDIAYHYYKSGIKKETLFYLEKAADYSIRTYNNEEAINFYDKIIEIGGKTLPAHKYIDISLKKCKILDSIGDWSTCSDLLKEHVKYAKNVKDKKYLAKAHSQLGAIYKSTGNYELAMENFNNSLKIYTKLSDQIGVARILNEIAIVHYFKSDYETSMKYSQKQLKISKKLNDLEGINEAMGNIGLIYSDTGKSEEAFKCYEFLMENAKKTGTKFGEAVAICNIGVIYEEKGDYTKAMDCYQKASAISNETGFIKLKNNIVNNIGVLHWRNGDFDKARDHFKVSMNLSLDMGDKRSAGIASSNIGGIYHKQGFYKKAMKYYAIDLKTTEELGDKRGMSIIYRNIGKAHHGLKDYHKAIEYYDMGIKIAEEHGIIQSLFTFLLSKSESYLELGDLKNAEKSIDKSIRIIKNTKAENSITSKVFFTKQKIAFILAASREQKIVAVNELKKLLKNEKRTIEMGYLNYEIAVMLKELKMKYDSFKNTAIDIYSELSKNTPDIEYKTKYKALKNLK